MKVSSQSHSTDKDKKMSWSLNLVGPRFGELGKEKATLAAEVQNIKPETEKED